MIIVLDRLWLSAVDGTDARSFELNDPLTHTPTVTRERRRGAAGNFYTVRTPGVAQDASGVLLNCTDEDVAWLKAHLEETLCWRDPRGLKLFGFYDADGFAPRTMPDSWSVTLAFTGITFSEET